MFLINVARMQNQKKNFAGNSVKIMNEPDSFRKKVKK